MSIKAVIFGATGAVGNNVLKSLVNSPSIASVTEVSRKHLDITDDKIEKVTLTDDVELRNDYDLVFITLGTTRKKAGSAERFEKIDRHLVVDLAKKVASDKSHLLYCSAAGSNPNSPFLYPKSKGLTEYELGQLGYKDVTIFRPGFLAGANRNELRLAESIFGAITGLVSYVYDGIQINVKTLGQAMVNTGIKQYNGEDIGVKEELKVNNKEEVSKLNVITNSSAIKLA